MKTTKQYLISIIKSSTKPNNTNINMRVKNVYLIKFTLLFAFLFLIACATKIDYTSDSVNNKSLVKTYSKELIRSSKQNLFAIQSANYSDNNIENIKSECEASYDPINHKLVNKDQCYARFWMKNLANFEKPYEFILDFEFPNGLSVPENKYPLQIFLGNSPNGYTWIGINQKGELLLSYIVKDQGYTDIILSDSNFKVNPKDLNKLKFVQMPNGYFYLDLNNQKKWSFDLEEDLQKIPFTGLSNRIAYYTDVSIKKLELNVLTQK